MSDTNTTTTATTPLTSDPVLPIAQTLHISAEDSFTPLAEEDEQMIDLAELLDLAIEKEASDVHLGTGSKIALRIYGEIRFIETAGVLTEKEAERLIFAMLKGQHERDKLLQNRELDFSYKHNDGTTFRGHAFFRRGRMSAVMRRIAKAVPTIDELGVPSIVHQFAQAKQGLVLVTGPTGSGKSTTLCSVLEEINETRVEHIVTIEDPIEYIFTDKKCVFSQRELYYDTHSFEAALRAAMRQDPDIVMIGELRDRETITSALNLCETGHLVFSTLHTSSAAQTISRIAQAYPLEQRDAILGRIADSLLGVVSQRLLPKIGGGRVGVYEVMTGSGAIRNAIRQWDLPMIENTIATSGDAGMITMKRAADELIRRGLIDYATVEPFLKKD